MKRLYIVSLGCSKNLIDSEAIVYKFSRHNFILVFDEKKADTVLINTCAFLNSAVKESDSIINYYLDLKRKGKIENLIIAGCLVERLKDDILKKYPEVDAFFGVDSYDRISDFLSGTQKEKLFIRVNKKINIDGRTLLTLPHSTYLKIADGCNNFCSYCTIPYIRGRYRSRKIEDLIEEVKSLVKLGVKEISLIAQDTTKYGVDLYEKPRLVELLKRIEKMDIKWIRILYLYPSMVDKELIDLIKSSKKIVHYIDLPFQHISDKILKLMNRKYDSKAAYKLIDLIKSKIDDVAIRSSFIVGFPYETEKDFNEVLRFIEYAKFTSISLFKYSREKQTPSYNMPQIDWNEKNRRYKEVLKLQSRIVDEFNKKIISKEFEVLFDTPSTARSYMDAPDVDGRFELLKEAAKPGEFRKVKVVEAKGYIRKGVLV